MDEVVTTVHCNTVCIPISPTDSRLPHQIYICRSLYIYFDTQMKEYS